MLGRRGMMLALACTKRGLISLTFCFALIYPFFVLRLSCRGAHPAVLRTPFYVFGLGRGKCYPQCQFFQEMRRRVIMWNGVHPNPPRHFPFFWLMQRSFIVLHWVIRKKRKQCGGQEEGRSSLKYDVKSLCMYKLYMEVCIHEEGESCESRRDDGCAACVCV
uniref:Uncharacterized protein TCIL3000_7_1990 n=1 Tax=Trypanosoma congolense (strain IL3000) TaxID=1068625 RepID=G0UPS8_TRYCI|nr:unnamed protein product [Trypanosoma congolense IL3000]